MPSSTVEMPCLSALSEELKTRTKGTFWEKPVEFLLRPIFWLMLAAVMFCFVNHPIYNPTKVPSYYYTNGDTNEYTQYPVNILNGETALNRTPVYPYFLKFVYWITGGESILVEMIRSPEGAPLAAHVVQGEQTCFYVVCFQMILFLAALIPFYYACQIILRNFIVCCAVFLWTAYTFVVFQWWIMTEPLAVSGSLLFFSLYIFYLNRPSYRTAIALGILAFFMVMLRPASLYLVLLLLGFWVLRLFISPADRKPAFVGFCVVLAAMMGLYGYAGMNQKNHGLRTISSVALNNHFNILYEMKFYQKSSDSEILEAIEQADPQVFANRYRLYNELVENFGQDRVRQFVYGTVKEHFADFMVLNLKRMWWESDLYSFRPLYFFGVFDFLLLVGMGGLLRTFPWYRLGMWGYFWGLMFVMYYGCPDCYRRLIVPALPVLGLLVVRYFDWLSFAQTHSLAETKDYLKTLL
ncbi:MAG: hypothetical protein IJQ31_03940 [Thermoguttaceae bacterium]|nr:hypothetical protein [Thermoguttaceae bacterium]